MTGLREMVRNRFVPQKNRHLNVQKQQIDRFALQYFYSTDRTFAGRNEFQAGRVGNEFFEQRKGEMFVVDQQAPDRHHVLNLKKFQFRHKLRSFLPRFQPVFAGVVQFQSLPDVVQSDTTRFIFLSMVRVKRIYDAEQEAFWRLLK